MFKDKQEEKFYREATDTFCNYSDPYASYSEHMWKAGCDYTKEKLIEMGWTPPGEKQVAKPAVAVNEAFLKDAERYRWLRDSKHDPALVIDKRTKWVPEDASVPGVGGYWEYEYRSGEELDLAIDAAIAKAKGGV